MLLTKVLVIINFSTHQFISMHKNQVDPDLADFTQINKFCLELFGGLEWWVSTFWPFAKCFKKVGSSL
jgi:hypothetical protein